MLKQILDLHIHSKYSRACSKSLDLPHIAQTCLTRGVDIVVTGDFTHPQWFKHLKTNLLEINDGIYVLKSDKNKQTKTKFIIGTELSSIKKDQGKTRRIHVCVYAPNLEIAEKFNKNLEKHGFNLKSDGRPILGLTVKHILELMLETDKRMVMIPAHIWTPWFGLFGSNGGYDSIEQAFGELKKYIFAMETGLSSDPLMNWQWSDLDQISLVSNSDAHSLEKIGREANIFAFKSETEINYQNIFSVIKNQNKNEFLATIEFFPEEGKYHFDGHRLCNFVCSPAETKKLNGICPVCHKPLVVGVANRVYELSDRNEEQAREFGKKNKVPYFSIVPLPEIIAELNNCGVKTKKVQKIYQTLIEKFGPEFKILLSVKIEELKKFDFNLGSAIEKVRQGKVFKKPGYDGEFGKIKVFADLEKPQAQINFNL